MRFVRCKDRITGAGRQRRAKAEKRAATTTASSAETAAAAAAKTLAPSSRSPLSRIVELWSRRLLPSSDGRLQLREDLSAEGKGVWEVKWTQFTGRAYYFNHFEKRKFDVMPRELDKLGQFPSIRRLSRNTTNSLQTSVL